jgi:hypothetical protein
MVVRTVDARAREAESTGGHGGQVAPARGTERDFFQFGTALDDDRVVARVGDEKFRRVAARVDENGTSMRIVVYASLFTPVLWAW